MKPANNHRLNSTRVFNKFKQKAYTILTGASFTKEDVVIVVATTLRSSCDNLGWQYVYEVLSKYINIIPLFYDKEHILLDLDGNEYKKKIDYALVSVPSDIHIPNFIHIYNTKLKNAQIYAGGFAVSSSVNFFSSVCSGIFKGAFDGLKKEKYKEIAFAIKNKTAPPYFTKDKKDIIHRRDDENIIPSSVILHKESVFKDSFIIEVNRGCPFSCRFCEIPKTGGNVLYYEKERILETVRNKAKNIRRVTLIGTAIATHPEFDEIIKILTHEGYDIAFSSMRADRLEENIVKLIGKTKTNTITLAPEAGSEKLKKYLNKNISSKRILHVFNLATENGIRKIKLYYIIGIPTETDSDIKAIYDEIKTLVESAKEKAKERKWMPIISVSVNPYIIKPLSENRDETFVRKDEYERKVSILTEYINSIGGVNVTFLNYYEAFCEMKLSTVKSVDIKDIKDLHKLSYKKLAKTLEHL